MTLNSDAGSPGDSEAATQALQELQTFFASPERSAPQTLRYEVERLSCNPIIDGLLHSVGGLLAVLNEHRQILAVNEKLLHMLGFENPAELLGLRPGEVLHCTHAREQKGGCGTSEFCASCGAVLAIVSSLATNKPVERLCSIDIESPSQTGNLFLRVQACPIRYHDSRVLLLFIQDVTREQQAAALERVFFHDLNNTLTGMLAASSVLAEAPDIDTATTASDLMRMTRSLARQIELQHCIALSNLDSFKPSNQEGSAHNLLTELRLIAERHPSARGKCLQILAPEENLLFLSDATLLQRVVYNMILNALEATQEGGRVKLSLTPEADALLFCVWNEGHIPEAVQKRIFQRNFSTKDTLGRGLGTFSMKLLGEKLLQGKVWFTSDPKEGTCFNFRLPLRQHLSPKFQH